MSVHFVGPVPEIRAGVLVALEAFAKPRIENYDALIAESGLQPAASYTPMAFISLVALGEILERISSMLNDDCLGLRIGQAMVPGGTGLLGHVVMTAATARDALTVSAAFAKVFVPEVEAGYSENYVTGIAEGWWQYPEGIPARRQIDCFTMVCVLSRLRDAMGDGWYPQLIKLEGRRPQGCPECAGQGCKSCDDLVRSVLGDRVSFEEEISSVSHPLSALNAKMRGANAMAHQLHFNHAERALAELCFADEWLRRARLGIQSVLQRQIAPSLADVSKEIGETPRALKSGLLAENTNFETVLNNVRKERADRLLRETDMPLSKIAYDLGYSDPSIFTRAAYRWFDVSPRKYRQSVRRPLPPADDLTES